MNSLSSRIHRTNDPRIMTTAEVEAKAERLFIYILALMGVMAVGVGTVIASLIDK